MNAELEKYECKLWKRVDIDSEHYLVAIPDQHYTVGMDEMKFEPVEYAYVPSHTRFSKLPSYRVELGKEEMVEKLRKQKEYWEEKMNGKKANELNRASASDDVDKQKNIESFYRFQKRAEVCAKFIDALQEEPTPEDLKVHGQKYTELTYEPEDQK
jgi:hypothetical protein